MSTIVLTLFLVLANGAGQTLEVPGVWDGDQMKPFDSIQECARMAQIVGAGYVSQHPGVRLDGFTCGTEARQG